MRSGLFVSFEGGEGGGKTTQSSLLYEALEREGVAVLRTREPGGTPSAEQIRNLLVQGDTAWEKMTELLLHFAARVEHVEKVVKPALAKGITVICDRFTDSTLAYQGYGHQLGGEIVEILKNITLGNFQPDITFFLDIAPKAGIGRTHSRTHNETRYEQMGDSFHQRVHNGFVALSKANPSRFIALDATHSIEALHAVILKQVKARLRS